MRLTPQKLRSRFLNFIMKINNISQKSIQECLEKNKDEIFKMDQIFDSDDEMNVRKRMALLSIISQKHKQENMDYYRTVTNTNSVDENSDIRDYTVLIIAALVFNTTFYACARNWHGLIRQEINRINEIKKLLNLATEGFSEYLEMENKINTVARNFPYEDVSDTENLVPLTIHPAGNLNDFAVDGAAYSKDTKTININYRGRLPDEKFILWIVRKGWYNEPVPICLQRDSDRILRGQFDGEIPKACKFIVLAEKEENAARTQPLMERGIAGLKILKEQGERLIITPQGTLKAAAPERNQSFPVFYHETFIYKGVPLGKLYFKGNDQNEIILKFVFDKIQDEIPFEIKVYFRTKQDEKIQPPITLPKNSIDGGRSIKTGRISGINYSGGIEGISEEEYRKLTSVPQISD